VRYFPAGIVDQWLSARPEDFAAGFVECWKVWREKT